MESMINKHGLTEIVLENLENVRVTVFKVPEDVNHHAFLLFVINLSNNLLDEHQVVLLTLIVTPRTRVLFL